MGRLHFNKNTFACFLFSFLLVFVFVCPLSLCVLLCGSLFVWLLFDFFGFSFLCVSVLSFLYLFVFVFRVVFCPCCVRRNARRYSVRWILTCVFMVCLKLNLRYTGTHRCSRDFGKHMSPHTSCSMKLNYVLDLSNTCLELFAKNPNPTYHLRVVRALRHAARLSPLTDVGEWRAEARQPPQGGCRP